MNRIDQIRSWVNRWWRRVLYLWFNPKMLRDPGIALLLFLFIFFVAGHFLEKTAPSPYSATEPMWAILSLLPPILMLSGFFFAYRHLRGEAAYEQLRTAKRPSRTGILTLLLQFPVSAVVVFALLAGIALASWGYGGWGPAVQASLMHVIAPLPPPLDDALVYVIHWLGGEETAPWPAWLDFVLSGIYSFVVFALVAAWFERHQQRHNYVASLFTEDDRPQTPFGFRTDSSSEQLRPESHEQVLLMRAERIGAGCLPYLKVELSAPEWQTGARAANRCRGVVAAVGRVFLENANSCWQSQPKESDWIADWLVRHLDLLVEQDRKSPDPTCDHRLGELIEAVAAVLASGYSLLPRPKPMSWGAYHDTARAEKFRAHLRYLFSRSPDRPTLLIAACNAAERLGTPEDLQLLDEQTRRLDVQAGFSIEQTDRILQTRDRVLAKEPLRSNRLARLRHRAQELGLEEIPTSGKEPLRFRRPSDGAEMVLVEAGSFRRGDDHNEETSPRRRVHLESYLIDITPVSRDAFQRWVKEAGRVLRVERGFFPVQGLPEDEPRNNQYASHVTWFAAQAYAQWAVRGGHLPTEAQWEKAARGSEDDRRYPTGDTWVEEPVSPYGVRICHLLEWTLDTFDRRAYHNNPVLFDPRMETSARFYEETKRVVRGRAPDEPVGSYSLVKRMAMEPITGAFTAPVGFRVVVELKQESS